MDFRFSLKQKDDPLLEVSDTERKALSALAAEVDKLDEHSEQSLSEAVYRIAAESGFEPAEFFALVYRVLIGKEKGPRLAAFIITAGRDRIQRILQKY